MALDIVDYKVEDDRYNFYEVYFSDDRIRTTVTSNPDVVTVWINITESHHRSSLHRLIVGLDIEWRPSFIRNQQNPVATLQLCVARRCLIFQLIHCDHIPNALKEFLGNTTYTFVGIGIKNDVAKLEKDYDISVDNVVELNSLAADAYSMSELKGAGLKRLCEVVLGRGIEKPKRITMGKWDNKLLNKDQISYACVDAFVSFEIGKRLNASNK